MRATYETITLRNGQHQRQVSIDCKAKEYDRVCEILMSILGEGEWEYNWCGDSEDLGTCFKVYDREEFTEFMIEWKAAKKAH